jgi:hypothetical protein
MTTLSRKNMCACCSSPEDECDCQMLRYCQNCRSAFYDCCDCEIDYDHYTSDEELMTRFENDPELREQMSRNHEDTPNVAT